MNKTELIKITKALAVTAEICGTDLSDMATEVMIKRLSAYSYPQVHNALKKCMDDLTGRLTLAHIKQRIDDGRPAPEIAWSQVPKSEYESMVLTSEQNMALCSVSSMIDAGELIPARMAFLQKYKELVDESRANDSPVVYELAGGWDKQSRFDALKLAIEDGRMSQQRAVSYLPEYEPEFMDLPMLESEKSNARLIEGMAKQIGGSA